MLKRAVFSALLLISLNSAFADGKICVLAAGNTCDLTGKIQSVKIEGTVASVTLVPADILTASYSAAFFDMNLKTPADFAMFALVSQVMANQKDISIQVVYEAPKENKSSDASNLVSRVKKVELRAN